MFRGSVPGDMQRIIADLVRGLDLPVYVGCSGNFTIERVMAGLGAKELHGCDVTIYSSVIGAHLARQPFRMDVKCDAGRWLEPYVGDVTASAATIMLLSKLGFLLGGTTRHHKRMLDAYMKAWPGLHEDMVKKLNGLSLRLASYACEDVNTWIDRIPERALTIMFPPFFAGDYANMFKKLEVLFDWDAPTYTELTEESKKALFDKVMSKQAWILGLHFRATELAQFEEGMAQTTNRGVPIYVYSNIRSRKRVVTPRQEIAPIPVPRLPYDMEIGDRTWLAVLSAEQFQFARSQYMNPGIKPGSPATALGVIVEGRDRKEYLAGCLAFMPGDSKAQFSFPDGIAGPPAYMLSDFPIAPTKYARLAKLIVMAGMTKEVRTHLEALFRSRINCVVTTAFTSKPVSMKYRGVMELVSRGEMEKTGDAYTDGKFKLNYAQRAGLYTMAEALAAWKKHHGGKWEGS